MHGEVTEEHGVVTEEHGVVTEEHEKENQLLKNVYRLKVGQSLYARSKIIFYEKTYQTNNSPFSSPYKDTSDKRSLAVPCNIDNTFVLFSPKIWIL